MLPWSVAPDERYVKVAEVNVQEADSVGSKQVKEVK